VLEVEGWGEHTQAVLIEFGSNHGIRRGLRGRLIQDGSTIGEVVVEQVYPDGSRARVDGPLLAPVTSKTIVEIDVPVEAATEP
jgi:hypothetical protein